MVDQTYIGQELEIFAHAANWKRYFSDQIGPYVGGKVLEVGAGIGATTEVLAPMASTDWVCLEPDSQLVTTIDQKIQAGELPNYCRTVQGTIDQLPVEENFDTILYIDVLEHIEQDEKELLWASERLLPAGHLIVLAPAYNFLFSNFDEAIGHFRRYDREMLQLLTPPKTEVVSIKYLDAVGVITSLTNKFILGQSNPALSQIRFWDRWLVPVSRVVDHLVFHKFGRSIIGVWVKTDG